MSDSNSNGKVFAILGGVERHDLPSFSKGVFSWSFQSALESIETIEGKIPASVMQSKLASPKPLIGVLLSYHLAIYSSCIDKFLKISERDACELLDKFLSFTRALKFPSGAPIFTYDDSAFFEKHIGSYKIEISEYLYEGRKENLTYGPGLKAIDDIFSEYSLPNGIINIFEKMILYKCLQASVDAVVEAVFLPKLIELSSDY